MATNQFLTFTLVEELYAVEVAQVQEVLSEMPLTVIPRMPEYMKGVINIRGSVVPVVDLRTKFGLPETEKTVDTSIIVVDLHTEDATVTVGCLTDSVQEVLDIAEDSIQPTPSIGTSVDARFIRGLGKKDDRFIIMLDIDRVFQAEAEGLAAAQEAPVAQESATG
ncbi:MAG: chemotaxis protein CheW [Spirochaeta sp.]|jgi:purine-binding chemotaxis protein CheW|nr:chemotaxis protein CheW [Spirochaeta sp.]